MRTLQWALGLLALAQRLSAQSLPYSPTRLFLPANSSSLYMFRPSSQSPNQSQLLSLDLSNPLPNSQVPWDTVSASLPFLQDDERISYTPSLEEDGSITVIAGNCSDGADGMQIWRWDGQSADKWSQSKKSDQQLGSYGSQAGANYLSSSIAFSEHVHADDGSTNIFIFGGMCPSASSTAETWTSSAEYSNLMLTISPANSDQSADKYDVSAAQNRGPPIAQAGVSITPLPLTYTLSSNGDPKTQQQNFVLLGGHTQGAFINMSQVAVFSLPQQSWSFMPVKQPTNAKTDLAVRQDVEVTPRSGHTAVLSESGDRIVLFGGWVGDVGTPATPQLAVLQLGDGYGGRGDWLWTVPEDSGHGLSSGAGIYGHGAVMLPGGVMMVVGGYDIPSSSSELTKRASQSDSKRSLFYNITSNAWLESYKPPTSLGQHQQQHGSGPLSTTSEKIGLGTGLGVGACVLFTVLAFYFWYSKRVKRARQDRQRTLLTSSDGSAGALVDQPFIDKGGHDEQGGDDFALGRFWPKAVQASNAHPRPPPMQHTTGMFVNMPSPTRGLRKGVASKNYQYHAAPRYDENRLSRASGNIHPIAEQENEDDSVNRGASLELDRLDDAEAKLREVERVLTSGDPFADPEPNPLGSHPVSPETTETVRRVPTSANRITVPINKITYEPSEAANWVAVSGSNDGAEERGGRASPSRSDDRTSSTLSERSQRSATSNNSIQRTMSTRTGMILSAALAANRQAVNHETSPTVGRTQTTSTIGSYHQARARSSTTGSVTTPGALNSPSGDGESFMTARSNFLQLQDEGETLLGGRPVMDRDDPYRRAMAAQSSTASNNQVPPIRKEPSPIVAPRRRPGLMGSLRRALNVVSIGDRSLSLTSSAEHYKDEMRSSSSSPTKDRAHKIGSSPRRAVSDGGALLRHKRGQKDWDEKEWPPYRDNPDADDWGEPKAPANKTQAEEDWDVEEAASKRDFQVMFTVPKSRLRVVNDDMDRASLRSASDGAVSRNGSVKTTIRREESLMALRARSEGEGLRLPSTEEEKDELDKAKAA
ncbi:hypothetical protein LTR37_002314 [Vermiconidia calcicola]|uniref:Uncharacterized protein n=1 Tax=Vermiconidia calcicola TaxID=1690605 RepID=A0ACC3NU69_9PEZI|nr:hypothetical protein LTR37_002314 [Vermiconidia calcicola]